MIGGRVAAALAALFLAPGLAAAAPTPSGRLPDVAEPVSYALTVTPDAGRRIFSGHVTLAISVRRPTRTLTLNAADLDVSRAHVEGSASAPQIALDPAAQTLTLTFAEPLRPGRRTLDIDYQGRIFEQASGLFSVDYGSGAGARRALFTQFENSDARRFLPCFDEPAAKARFTLTVVAPTDETAVSNMPVASETPAGPGLKRVRFETTPAMSTYLLFFALGDFERIHRAVGGVDVGVIAPRGDLKDAAFALESARRLLPYYERYFSIDYPLPKLDLVAGPGDSQFFTAMENWGAIFLFEDSVLVDPASGEADRQGAFVTVAHEIAHQWFGDLVTMRWWDNLWLNEGFASWMEGKTQRDLHPEWRAPPEDLEGRFAAMRTDALAGSHAVVTPVDSVLEAGELFDDITYAKGAAVVRMTEAYVGESDFRSGVRRYLSAHQYGSTVSDDFWAAIAASTDRPDVRQMADDFTLRPGVPLVTLEDARCAGGVTTATLRETAFDGAGPDGGPGRWRAPIAVQAAGGGRIVAMVTPGDAVRVSVPGCGALLLNAGQAGWMRTGYDAADFARLEDAYPGLATEDQAGALDDALALGEAGSAPLSRFLDLVARTPVSAGPTVWSEATRDLSRLRRLFAGRPGETEFAAFARGRLSEAFAHLGWTARAGDPPGAEALRADLAIALADLGDARIVADARARLAEPAAKGAGDPARRIAMSVVAVRGDATEFSRLEDLARTSADPVYRLEVYALLGSTEDPALAERALALALSPDVEPTTRPVILRAVSARHPDLALAFVAEHWDAIARDLEPNSRAMFAPELARRGVNAGTRRALETFAEAHIPAGARGDVTRAEAAVAEAEAVRAGRLGEAADWLRARAERAAVASAPAPVGGNALVGKP